MNMEPTEDSPSSNPQQYSSWPSHLYHHHQLWLNSYNSPESPTMFAAQNHPTHTFNLNREDTVLDEQDLDDQSTTNSNQEPPQAGAGAGGQLEKEPMFEKPLTPSDVGKLNRLVIPKQHAEKYFPLGGESGDKGLLLSFEDESGKCWRFRYSYWNSSQSYVLTKGWSKYVKDKRLDAGDVIQFERHRRDSERLFIGWRRRGVGSGTGTGTGGGGWNRNSYSSAHPYPAEVQNHGGVTVPYQPQPADCLHAENQAAAATPVGNSKRFRLFGVNLECQLDGSEPSTPDGSSLSTQSQAPAQQQQFYSLAQAQQPSSSSSYSSNRHSDMDIIFSQDVNQMMRNRQG